MRRGMFLCLLAGLFVQMSPATTIGVYFNRSDWEAAMSLNGTNPLTPISFSDAQWTSSLQLLPRSSTLVSQSSTNNGMNVTIDSSCSAPGVCGQPGQVSNGVWVDSLSKYSTTDFLFSSPVYGFGGDFDITGGNGLFIGPGGELPYPQYTGGNPFFAYPSYNGFIGIVTDQPNTDLFISWGDNGSCYRCFYNSYTLNNFEVATLPTPEPDFRYPIAGMALLAGCYAARRRS